MRLGLDWMAHLTLREFSALADCHLAHMRSIDIMHARTRVGMTGGSIQDLLIYKMPKVTPAGGGNWDYVRSFMDGKFGLQPAGSSSGSSTE